MEFDCQRTYTSGSSVTLPQPLDLYLLLAFQAEAVDADAVFQGLGELLDPLAETVQGFGFQTAFKDGVLHPLPEVLQRVGETGPPTVVGNIIGDDDQHGKRKGS